MVDEWVDTKCQGGKMLTLKYNNGIKLIACYCEEADVYKEIKLLNTDKNLHVRYIPNPSLLTLINYNFNNWLSKFKKRWLTLKRK